MEDIRKGCTVISYVAKKAGVTLPEEACCDEHDVAYNQGGSLLFKAKQDWKFVRCVAAKNGKVVGWFKAGLGLLALTFTPYPYIAWNAPEVPD